MKPLYVKKNGLVNKLAGIAIPASYPSARIAYDNSSSGLSATNAQAAIDEIAVAQGGGVQSDWNESDNTKLDYIKNKPQNLVQDASYVHTDNNYTSTEKTKLSGIETGAQVNTITGVKGNAESSYRTGNVNITPTNIGLGNADNTSDATKKTNFTGSIASGNTGFTTGGDVYTALQGKVNTETGKGLSSNDYTNTDKTKVGRSLNVDNLTWKQEATTVATRNYAQYERFYIISTGEYAMALSAITSGTTLVKDSNYMMIDIDSAIEEFDTDISAIKTKLATVSTGANKVESSTINGNIRIDGTETQVYDGSGKVDKVTGATNGNLAGLNGSGNLTDSGWNGAKDTTSISGNPISISGLKANQLAVNPIITLEPIQAGSGTPSPSNIRAISGYDKIEVLSCGKNLFPEDNLANVRYENGVKSPLGNAIGTNGFIFVKSSTTYYCSISAYSRDGNCRIFWYDKSFNVISYDTPNTSNKTCTSPTNAKYATIYWEQSDNPAVYRNDFIFCEDSLTDKSYVPYHKTTDLSESLGQTVYGGTHEVRTGKANVTWLYKDLGDFTWSYDIQYQRFMAEVPNIKLKGARELSFVCSCYECISDGRDVSNVPNYGIYTSGSYVYIHDSRYTNATTFKTEVTGQTIAYPIATPTEIQLTPHEISLLKDYAYVSTNGTNIALDYHNGELASLSDVAQLAETYNRFADYVKSLINS